MNSCGKLHTRIWFDFACCFFFFFFSVCCTTAAAAAIKGAIFLFGNIAQQLLSSSWIDSRGFQGSSVASCQFQVQVQRAPHKTHWPLTPPRLEAWAQTPFAKEIFGQKSVANKNCCCCCCCVIVVAIGHHCAARRVAPYLPASAAAADLAAFCCWCCNHVKCQFAFCAIRATLHKHSQSSIWGSSSPCCSCSLVFNL